MKANRQNDLVLSVSCAQDNRWYVTAQDAPHPLASFADAQQACTWAIARAKPARGKVLVEQFVGTSRSNAPDASDAKDFKFSIPVTWGDGDARGNLQDESPRAASRSRGVEKITPEQNRLP